MTNFYETIISMKKIENYLKQDEVNENNIIDKECFDNNIRLKMKMVILIEEFLL